MTAPIDERDLPTTRRTGLWAAIVIATVMIVFVAVLATRPSATDRQAQSPLLGKPAPAVAGTAVDGAKVDATALRGRFVLVNFFASWCASCVQEHPELVRFSQRHQVTGDAAVVSVIFSDDVASVRRFVADKGAAWPIIPDPGGHIAYDFGVRGPPESFLIDRSGNVVSKIIGTVQADSLDRLISEAKARGL
jgi:cytochrome c biogenesis protein CcmG/thiol:disulfide interchange protein DsbE